MRTLSSFAGRHVLASRAAMSSLTSSRSPPRALASPQPRQLELSAPIGACSSRATSSEAASSSASSSSLSSELTSSSLSSSSSSSPSSFARFAVLTAAFAGLAAVGGATAPHAAAAALIDAASSSAPLAFSAPIDDSSSTTYLVENLHHLFSSSPSPSPSPIADLADSNDFWSNLLRYVSFYFSVLLGTAATAVKPVAAALRRSPASAAGVVAVAVVVGVLVTKTVGAMLGVDDGSPDDLSAFLNSMD